MKTRNPRQWAKFCPPLGTEKLNVCLVQGFWPPRLPDQDGTLPLDPPPDRTPLYSLEQSTRHPAQPNSWIRPRLQDYNNDIRSLLANVTSTIKLPVLCQILRNWYLNKIPNTCRRVHHTIPTDSVPTDAIPTVHAQSGRRVADCSWISLRAVLIGKTPNQNPKIRGSTIALKVRCNFSGGGGTPDPLGYPLQAPLPSVTSVPRSMPCFRRIQRLDPFQFLPNFYYFYICQAC